MPAKREHDAKKHASFHEAWPATHEALQGRPEMSHVSLSENLREERALRPKTPLKKLYAKRDEVFMRIAEWPLCDKGPGPEVLLQHRFETGRRT